MTRKITDPKLNMFMEFFRAQGCKFVDMDTGEEILPESETSETD